MRKFILFFAITMIIAFILPNIFLIDVMKEENVIDFKDEIENKKITEKKKIKLLLTNEQKIIELDIDDYIKGVLIGEVPITYEIEALKAQAVVARTYTFYKLNNQVPIHNGADMCDDINCCQCYKTKEYAFSSWNDSEEEEKWTKLESAVEQTENKYITYSGEIISAFFHAHSGGKTEDVKFVWCGEDIPYLKSVDGKEENICADSKKFSHEEFANMMRDKVNDINANEYQIKIIDYTGSGRVNNLNINETLIKATELRKVLGLRSTNLRFEKNEDEILFYTVGYGHGVGMSQEGANQMAKEGYAFEEIIKHFYTGVSIEDI